jgi:hypothetical protein
MTINASCQGVVAGAKEAILMTIRPRCAAAGADEKERTAVAKMIVRKIRRLLLNGGMAMVSSKHQ